MNVFYTAILTLIISSSLLIGTVVINKTKISSRIAATRKQASNSSGAPIVDINAELKQLSTKAPQLNPEVLKLALTAYDNAEKKGDVKKPVLTVVDYSLASNKQRMWIFDLQNENLLYNTYVAHGRNSGEELATRFSNNDSSKESSLGTYVTGDPYIGHKGYSLNINGLDKGFNDNALNRRVVVHGAWYVDPDFIQKAGRAGCSWGCLAVGQSMAAPVINTIKGGSVIFSYYPDSYFLSHSAYLAS